MGHDIEVFSCFKKIYELTRVFMGTLYPTAIMFYLYKEFCEIMVLFGDWSVSQDITISAMTTSMSRKFEKYCK